MHDTRTFRCSSWFYLVAASILTPMMAIAQDTEPGRQEFMISCGSCHGESATGNGPISEYLKVPAPNLTTLSQQNEGEFPFLYVFQMIDGRTGIGAHGSDMPIWGDRFKAAEIQSSTEYGAEMIVRGRILSIAEYLASIQQ